MMSSPDEEYRTVQQLDNLDNNDFSAYDNQVNFCLYIYISLTHARTHVRTHARTHARTHTHTHTHHCFQVGLIRFVSKSEMFLISSILILFTHTGIRGFRPSKTQISLLSYRDLIESCNFA